MMLIFDIVTHGSLIKDSLLIIVTLSGSRKSSNGFSRSINVYATLSLLLRASASATTSKSYF